jgi:hypothetical protein
MRPPAASIASSADAGSGTCSLIESVAIADPPALETVAVAV